MGGNRLVEHDTFLDVMEMLGGLRPASTWSWSALDEYSTLNKTQLDLIFKACLFNEGLLGGGRRGNSQSEQSWSSWYPQGGSQYGNYNIGTACPRTNSGYLRDASEFRAAVRVLSMS